MRICAFFFERPAATKNAVIFGSSFVSLRLGLVREELRDQRRVDAEHALDVRGRRVLVEQHGRRLADVDVLAVVVELEQKIEALPSAVSQVGRPARQDASLPPCHAAPRSAACSRSRSR